MSNINERSAAVTASGVIAIIGSVLNLPSADVYPLPVMAHMRAFSSLSLLLLVVILAILVHYRSRFLEACASAQHS